jgi:hypothetical protein
MIQKQRNTFALKNFRGLDKENKLLKVQPYRATDGYNFIIDSETLKTRPSFTMSHNPKFFLEEDDYLIDWHLFDDIYIYITRRHIYMVDGNTIINETFANYPTVAQSKLIKSSFTTTLDFEGLKPIFQEEKNALFIFGLNEIYVFSYLKNGSSTAQYYVLYNLKNKPVNPFAVVGSLTLKKEYEDLPEPYVPTILLGNNVLEDVNLLSNKSRYQLFANVPTTILGTTTYNIPTYYNQEKHGVFTSDNIKITFYKDRYESYTVFPVFMGVQSEDWFGSITIGGSGQQIAADYGEILNANNPIIIENTFFPIKEFLYIGIPGGNNNITVYERIVLPKKTFFEFIVKGSNNQTAFEYLMGYIKQNQSIVDGWVDNKVLKFVVSVQNESVYEDNQQRITHRIVERKDFFIYVQLKKFDSDFTLDNVITKSNATVTTNLADAYPAYPTFTNNIAPPIFELNNGSPIISTPTTYLDEFKKLSEVIIDENKNIFSHNQYAGVKAKMYTTSLVQVSRQATLPTNTLQEDVYEKTELETFAFGNYPAYPTFNNPNNYLVFDFGVIPPSGPVDTQTYNFTFAEGTLERSTLLGYTSSAIDFNTNSALDVGFAIVKARMYKQQLVNVPDLETGEITQQLRYKNISVIMLVTVGPAFKTQEVRYALTYEARVNKDPQPVVNRLYQINLKEENSVIELKVKDYFYDYKNEPSIDVLVTFNQNTDYDIIAKSRFGITFGSENRLFLAGNKDFPNIDRFNVSNDLLGDNTTNQSYEFSYFPSKNYRVLGGKGAVNGYVVATDSQLYVTKETYPNDSKLFVRQRNVDENGRVSYVEYKTNITKTPLNNRCIVRFYNDILILAKDGLFGIEISQNVLTDERLVKLRSGFINKDLVSSMEAYDSEKIFIIENNIYMYIFVGDKLYVADSRYISQNPNSAAENVSYEIIEWKNNTNYLSGKVIDEKIFLVEENNNFIYSFSNFNSDDLVRKGDLDLTYNELEENEAFGAFTLDPTEYAYVFANPSQYVLNFENMGVDEVYRFKAYKTLDYTISGNTVTVLNIARFIDLSDGDVIYAWRGGVGFPYQYVPVIVRNLTATTFNLEIPSGLPINTDQLFVKVTSKNLYINTIFTYPIDNKKYIVLSDLKPEQVNEIPIGTSTETIIESLDTTNNFIFSNFIYLRSVRITKKTPIQMRWVSAITDFENSQMEKTSFKVNLYATKKEEANSISFGYRTMRRMAGLSSAIDLSNNFDFKEVEYNQFALATFDTVAISIPMKESNFLYIQFVLNGVGKIEMNAIEVIYKLNRMLKSIG